MRKKLLLAVSRAALHCAPVVADDAPAVSDSWRVRSAFYRDDLIRESRAELGLNAPIALFAGQIHQESLWKKSAQSKYANGLTQFTPSTEKWIKTIYPSSLGDSGAFNPQWAIRALVKYDNWLYQRIDADDDCERWAMTLSAYNGGLGWVKRDKRLTAKKGDNPLKWWDNVEHHSRRARWAIKENRGYPRNIIYKHQDKYHWGGKSICTQTTFIDNAETSNFWDLLQSQFWEWELTFTPLTEP